MIASPSGWAVPAYRARFRSCVRRDHASDAGSRPARRRTPATPDWEPGVGAILPAVPLVGEAFKDLIKAWGRSNDLQFIPEHEYITLAKERRKR